MRVGLYIRDLGSSTKHHSVPGVNFMIIKMDTSKQYALPPGVKAIPTGQLDLRPDHEINVDILNPQPLRSEKNIWFFWHQGFERMHPYTQRNIRAWYRRFSKQGWTIRVLDRVVGSHTNVSNFLDTTDPKTFPQAFINGVIGGDYGAQHTSDLVRWPLLLRYGGVYADVGLMQIGDLDALWNETVGNTDSPYEVLSYDMGDEPGRTLTNYFLCSRPGNAFFRRCHELLLALWAEDGGKSDTKGMHATKLLQEIPPMGGEFTIKEPDGSVIGPEEVRKLLTDYIIQGQVMTMVMSLVDSEDEWNGPKYVKDHVYIMEFMVGAQLINEMTDWDGRKAWELMSLKLPADGDAESDQQKSARAIVEACLSKSFAFKLAHGLILRVFGETLGSLWRKHQDSDNVPSTYAHWLRHGMIYWTPDHLPKRLDIEETKPLKVGKLLVAS